LTTALRARRFRSASPPNRAEVGSVRLRFLQLEGLAGNTINTGRYELSIAEATKATALDPDLAPPYASRALGQLRLNRLTDAEVTIRRATSGSR
jgi:Flp pilus assembly protein TadD